MAVDSWTIDVAARMHASQITQKQLALVSGYSKTYISLVLNHGRGNTETKRRILEALEALENR